MDTSLSSPFGVDARNPFYALAAAEILSSLSVFGTIEDVSNIAFSRRWPVTFGVIKRSDNDAPTFCVLSGRDVTMVFFQGTENVTQVASYVDATFRESVTWQGWPVNAAWNGWASAVAAELRSQGIADFRRVIVSGHSYGGAVAECLANELLRDTHGTDVQWVTFGSPKVGGPDLCNRLAVMPSARWMNRGDPIPFLPPDREDLPGFSSLDPLRLLRNPFVYDQPIPGKLLIGGGNVTSAKYPTDVDPVTLLSFDRWLIRFGKQAYVQHPASAYVARLREVCARLVPPRLEVLLGRDFPVEVPLDVLRDRDKIPIDPPPPDSVSRLVSNSGGGYAVNALGVRLMSFIPAQYRFKKSRLPSGRWISVWCGVVIAQWDTLSRCLTFNKSMNKVLRVMQTTADFSISDFQAAMFGSYLPAASAGGLGFSPDVIATSP